MEYRTQPGNRANSLYYLIGEYGYLKNRNQLRWVYLKCLHHPLCTGSAKINLDSNLAELIKPHLCESKTEDFSYLQNLQQMRDLATNTQRSLSDIYKAVIITAPASVKCTLTFPIVYQKLHHIRAARFPNNPASPAETCEVMLGDNPYSDYCQGVVQFEDQCGLLFASSQILEITNQIEEIFMDATFRIVPCNFPGGQVLTLLGDYNGTVIPFIHILMSGKREGLYITSLSKLVELCPAFNPTLAMADFEQAISNSLRRTFPDIVVKGCRFHFGQAVMKKLKSVGLHAEFMRVPTIRKWCRKYIAVCTLPSELVQPEVAKLRIETRSMRNR
jgi:hypothetical protein